jgi:hypothetical protein
MEFGKIWSDPQIAEPVESGAVFLQESRGPLVLQGHGLSAMPVHAEC